MAICCAAQHRRTTRACRHCSEAPHCPIAQRNREVERNLGLAHHVAERYIRSAGCRGGAAPEDIHAMTCAGMVACVDRFDASQGHQLSSYAVPYLQGVIRHHLRDHWVPLKVPRRLLELQQRGRRIQQKRLGRGLAPLPLQELAAQLNTSAERLREAELAWRALQRICSLDELPPGAQEPGD